MIFVNLTAELALVVVVLVVVVELLPLDPYLHLKYNLALTTDNTTLQ